MSIIITPDGTGFVPCLFTGTIVTPGERKQAVSKSSGKYSEFVETCVQFRRKAFEDDPSCYISLRIYSQKIADLTLKLRRGTQIWGMASVSVYHIDQWKNEHTKLFGNTDILLPISAMTEAIVEALEHRRYAESLTEYKPEPGRIDWSGGHPETGRDVAF